MTKKIIVPYTRNPLTIAATLARRLKNKCAPDEQEFADVHDLYNAMLAKAAKGPDGIIDENPEATIPWTPFAFGNTLHYTTGSRRMRIEVGDSHIVFNLFSPAYHAGEKSLCTVEVVDGILTQVTIKEDARPIVDEKLSRIDNLHRYLAPILGRDAIIAAADKWTAIAICYSAIKAAETAMIRYQDSVDDHIVKIVAKNAENCAYYAQMLGKLQDMPDY